jgi:hypothetical protein
MNTLEHEIKMSGRARFHLDTKAEIEKLREQMATNLVKMEELMTESNVTFFEMELDEAYNLQVQIKPHVLSVLDKEKLAADLGASKSDIKTLFLMACIENRSLTTDKYETYFFVDRDTKVNVRKKKKPKPKGKKKNQGL